MYQPACLGTLSSVQIDYLPAAGRQIPKITHTAAAYMLPHFCVRQISTLDYLPTAGRQIPKIMHIEEAVMPKQVLRELHHDWTFKQRRR